MEETKEMLKAFAQSCFDFVINNKKEEEVDNEAVDKRKLIDEVAGIMKSAGCDDEAIKTAIGKMEKIGYDKSEAKTADNKCKNEAEEEEVEVKEEEKTENKKEEKDDKKCDNSNDEDYMEQVAQVQKEINNSEEIKYVSRYDALEAGRKYFE